MPPDRPTIEKLNVLATQKLADIVRCHCANDPMWKEIDESEVAAARELLESAAVAGPR